MSTIESQIQKLNDTNAELARVNNELTDTVRTHTSAINNEVAAAKNTMAAATASAISEVKADANAVNAEIKARMDDAVVPWLPAMTKVQFDALRADRKQQYAGSGFVEWGKQYRSLPSINEGLWEFSSRPNQLFMGEGQFTNNNEGISKTDNPVAIIDGINHLLTRINIDQNRNYILFPPAPDGTKSYDSATGSVTQHTNAEVAFASETTTNKVITSRKDLMFLESWHEKIADKDVVYPLGNVQYGASSYEGVTLLNNVVAQGYSAFGEWDENTKGYGAKWSSLTDAQKALFLSKPEHNIYFDPQANAYIQVRYRIRVVEGLGDDWTGNNTSLTTGLSCAPWIGRYLGSGYTVGQVPFYIQPQSESIMSTGLITNPSGHYETDNAGGSNGKGDSGLWFKVGDRSSKAIPIALVQRMNQGAYHPSYNPNGTGKRRISGCYYYSWYEKHEKLTPITSAFDCFDVSANNDGGNMGSHGFADISRGLALCGRPDQYKYYNAIYAGQVEDLRLNANKLDVNKLREDAMRKAAAGEMRGKGKVPFTFVMRLKQWTTQLVNQGWVCFVEPDFKTNFYTHSATKDIPKTGGLSSFGLKTIGSFKVDGTVYTFDEVRLHPLDHKYIYFKLTAGTLANTAQVTNTIFTLQDSYKSTSEFDSLPWVDIIGDPERIAATFPDGVVGQWIPQIPDNNSQDFIFNEKANGEVRRQFTADDGATWVSGGITEDFINNGYIWAANALTVAVLSYESHSNFTEPSTNSIVNGGVGDVYYTTHSYSVEGNRLQGSLTGEIGKATADPAQAFAHNLGGYKIEIVNGGLSKSAMYPVKTGEVPLAPQGNDSPAVKALSTITEKNGLYYLQLHGVQLKYTEPDWGDDQTIPIIDGENIKTDLNGNTVKVFCHHTQIPLGIAHND